MVRIENIKRRKGLTCIILLYSVDKPTSFIVTTNNDPKALYAKLDEAYAYYNRPDTITRCIEGNLYSTSGIKPVTLSKRLSTFVYQHRLHQLGVAVLGYHIPLGRGSTTPFIKRWTLEVREHNTVQQCLDNPKMYSTFIPA